VEPADPAAPGRPHVADVCPPCGLYGSVPTARGPWPVGSPARETARRMAMNYETKLVKWLGLTGLAVVLAGCPGGDDGETGAETGPSPTTTTDPGTTTMDPGTTTMDPGTTTMDPG